MNYLISLLFSVSIGAAQGFQDPAEPQSATVLRQQGQLFTVQLVLGEPMRFFVVGKEEAKIDPSTLKVTVRRLKPYPGKVLNLDLQNGYFVAADASDLKDATALEVTAKSNAKSDKVQFKIEKPKP